MGSKFSCLVGTGKKKVINVQVSKIELAIAGTLQKEHRLPGNTYECKNQKSRFSKEYREDRKKISKVHTTNASNKSRNCDMTLRKELKLKQIGTDADK